jgi:hypothetical protein
MTGIRLIVGAVVMGVAVPATVMWLLHRAGATEYFIIASCGFVGWGVADLLSSILSRPRLENRTPKHALRDWERRGEP